jgi:hypothetical protein
MWGNILTRIGVHHTSSHQALATIFAGVVIRALEVGFDQNGAQQR